MRNFGVTLAWAAAGAASAAAISRLALNEDAVPEPEIHLLVQLSRLWIPADSGTAKSNGESDVIPGASGHLLVQLRDCGRFLPPG
jgi:hypothetical protein